MKPLGTTIWPSISQTSGSAGARSRLRWSGTSSGLGPTHDDLEAILDDLLGPIYYRLLLTRVDVTDEYLWDLVVAIPWTVDNDRNQHDEPTTEYDGETVAGVSP